MVCRSILAVGLGLVLLAGTTARAAEDREAAAFFESNVRPVLVGCYACHSAIAEEGNLRLDTWEGITRGGKSKKPAVVPGAPGNSPLIQIFKIPGADPAPLNPHHLSPLKLADLETWVKSGAYYPPPMPEVAAPKIDVATKTFWSFVAPKEPVVPPADLKEWSANPIDRFVLAKLREKGLSPVGLADKRTLIRRATFDLTGLPPTPAEIDAFLADNSSDAFARVVDRLLASPRYGEEWGRHWLDIARYADTAGESADYPIPQAYLYRNWVIDSFNRDEPYDQFIRDQIAGDLLPAKDDADRRDKIIATGFIALSRRFSVRPERTMNLTIDDTIDTMGKGILGLTVGCARCHDHKFDPIPSQDYYALYGFFSSTRYPYSGSEERQHQDDLVPLAPTGDAQLAAQKEKLNTATLEVMRLRRLREQASDPDAKAKIGQQIKDAKAARDELTRHAPNVELAYAVADGDGHDAAFMPRGDPSNMQGDVHRAFLQVLGGQRLPADVQGSGRVQLAQWLTTPKNPLTARVIVNRLWQYHFGKGIVQTSSDFGARGTRPTHPELLDWLALRFMENGWSIKSLTRTIMLSRVYQLSPDDKPQAEQIDANNDWLWHFRRRRIEAESVRDAMLYDTGELDLSQGGPHPFPPASQWHFTQHNAFAAVYDSDRRSVYLMQQRIKRHPFFALFDGADTNVTTAQRTESATPLQALWLMNDPFVIARADALAGKLIGASSSSREQVNQAYRVILGRPAAADELDSAQNYLHAYEQKLPANIAADRAPRAALASLVQALFSSDEFIFVE